MNGRKRYTKTKVLDVNAQDKLCLEQSVMYCTRSVHASFVTPYVKTRVEGNFHFSNLRVVRD